MNRHIRTLKRLFMSKKAVSQVLAAILMIFMFVIAIGVVWGWLYPAYNRFQTTNTVNNMTSYMLRIDETIYDLYGQGEGSRKIVRIDPKFGQVLYDVGKTIDLRFSDASGAFNQSFVFESNGQLIYLLENRRGVILAEGSQRHLKGPSTQNIFFVNGTTSNLNYQGLTNLLLSRPAEKTMKIELDYRIRVYSWYDQIQDVLSITVNIMQLDIMGEEFFFNGYKSLKISYNDTKTIYTSTTTTNTDFYVDGSFDNLLLSERPLVFVKPSAVVNYTININIVVSQFIFYI